MSTVDRAKNLQRHIYGRVCAAVKGKLARAEAQQTLGPQPKRFHGALDMTSYNGGIPADQSDSVRLIRWNKLRAEQAFAVHANLLGLEELRPELKENPYWTMLRQDAYERFELAFEEVGK